jgi:LacI family transcriptional regulator
MDDLSGQRSGRATIYDVARHAGVAISTVSRVLNDAEDVSPQTRERVLRVVDKLQYRPHRTARSLAQKQLSTLAVAVPTFTMPIFTELLKGVQSDLRQHQIDLLLCDLGSTEMRLRLRRFMDRGAVDALLLGGMPVDDDLAQELESLGTAVVLVGAASPRFDSYWWDDVAGARTAVDYLLAQGHRRIGMLAAGEGAFGSDGRLQGYRVALEAAGLPFEEGLVRRGQTRKHLGSSEEAGYEAMQSFLEAAAGVTAVFAGSDVLAIGAWKAAQDRGVAVPEALSLVGYENIKVSRYIGLTTVDVEMQTIGEQAAELVVKRMLGQTQDAPASHQIHPKLIVRKTSGPSADRS